MVWAALQYLARGTNELELLVALGQLLFRQQECPEPTVPSAATERVGRAADVLVWEWGENEVSFGLELTHLTSHRI